MTTKPMSATTTRWLQVAVILLAAFAFIGNAGHAFELLHGNQVILENGKTIGEKYANQPWWLAAGGAALPDVLLIICVVRLRHNPRQVWGWVGISMAVGFVGWAGLATADDNLTSQICSLWPLAVAVVAAGLLDTREVPVRVKRGTTTKAPKVPSKATTMETQVPVVKETQGPKTLALVPGPVPPATDPSDGTRVEELLPMAMEIAQEYRTQTGNQIGWKALHTRIREREVPCGKTTAQKIAVRLAEPEEKKEVAHA